MQNVEDPESPKDLLGAEYGMRKMEFCLYNQSLMRMTIDHNSFERMLSEAKSRESELLLGTECRMLNAEE